MILIKEQYSIIELEKIKNNLHLMNKEEKYINNNEKEINNYIMADFDIKKIMKITELLIYMKKLIKKIIL